MNHITPGHANLPSVLVLERLEMLYKCPAHANLPNLPTVLVVASSRT